MKFLGKKWKFVTIVYLVVAYLYVIVINDMSISTLLLFYAGFLALTIILFLGTTIGIVGIVFQSTFNNDIKAAKLYKISYALKTNNVNILSSYGLIMLKEHNIKKALEIFEKCLTLQPYFLVDKIVKCNIAICHWKLNNVDKAIEMYEKIMTDFANTDYDEDDENIDKVITEDTDEIIVTTNSYVYAQDYTTLGFLYLLKKDYDEAILNSKKALILDENHAPALDNLGQIYYYMKDYEKAEEYLKSALDLKPHMADSNYYLGLVYEQQENFEEAKKYFDLTATCNINALNTVNQEEVDNKLKKYN
jgi:tetratricopeptide (TPR) repeat protein